MFPPDLPRRLVFSRAVNGLGLFSLSPLAVDDTPLLHRWFVQTRARFWGMQHATLAEVRDGYVAQIESPHQAPYLGLFANRPAFLLETYDPAHEPLGCLYDWQPGDRGMHLFVGPADGAPLHGFSHAVMQCVMAFLFTDPHTRRVVVEPDVCNERIHPLNRRVGFDYHHTVDLGHKTAWLATCTRQSFIHALSNPQEITA